MEGIREINELRSAEPVQGIKKSFMGGYNKKDVDSLMEAAEAEKNKIIAEYEEQISELKTSLSMVVRERDNAIAENNEIKAKCDDLLAQNERLVKTGRELSMKIEQLNEELQNARTIEAPVSETGQKEEEDKKILELEVENEQLIKNNADLTLKIERLNEKVMDLTQQLMDEKAENKQELLRLQGELHKKDVAFRLKTNNILENLSTVIKEVESINS